MLFYLVGIKGAALSSLAKILAKLGHIVRGVDVEDEFYTCKGMTSVKLENFSNMNLKASYYYIIGNAYQNHSVTNYIKNMNFKYDYYPVFLTKFFKAKKWLCIAGTHGKTTSTKLLSTILNSGISLIGDSSMSVHTGDEFILESCEYKNTFLNYKPDISLVLNVDYDHVDFFKTKADYDKSFEKFVDASNISIVNGDEFYYRKSNVITYGLNKTNDVVFTYEHGRVSILNKIFYMPVVGIKYAYDFVGTYLVAKLLDVKDIDIQKRLDSFKMPIRRYQKTLINNQLLVLDYAHHPNEIKAILETIKEEYPNKKLICVFEPHTLSRLQVFKADFKKVLSAFDTTYLANLFSSVREAHNIIVEKNLYNYLDFLLFDYENRLKLLNETECVICFLGAGDVDRTYEGYLQLLKEFVKA